MNVMKFNNLYSLIYYASITLGFFIFTQKLLIGSQIVYLLTILLTGLILYIIIIKIKLKTKKLTLDFNQDLNGLDLHYIEACILSFGILSPFIKINSQIEEILNHEINYTLAFTLIVLILFYITVLGAVSKNLVRLSISITVLTSVYLIVTYFQKEIIMIAEQYNILYWIFGSLYIAAFYNLFINPITGKIKN